MYFSSAVADREWRIDVLVLFSHMAHCGLGVLSGQSHAGISIARDRIDIDMYCVMQCYLIC